MPVLVVAHAQLRDRVFLLTDATTKTAPKFNIGSKKDTILEMMHPIRLADSRILSSLSSPVGPATVGNESSPCSLKQSDGKGRRARLKESGGRAERQSRDGITTGQVRRRERSVSQRSTSSMDWPLRRA